MLAPSSPDLPFPQHDASLTGGTQQIVPVPGWYGDPMGRAELRFWAGQEWTPWVWDGKNVSAEQPPGRRLLKEEDLAHLDFIDRVFLPEAQSLGLVTPGEVERLQEVVGRLATEVKTGVAPGFSGSDVAAPATSIPAPAVAPAQPPASAPHNASPPPQASRPPQALPPPTWWSRTRKAVGSDLAVHGLAYLGVLLFFVGVFGLVVFAFADVTPGVRPLAEVAIALAPFLAGTMLLKRQAITVGRALEVLGGILLPIMVATTFVDGAAFPPDPHGALLVIVLTLLVALIGAAYARWSMRHADSALRYLVAPMLWLTVAMATLGLGRAVPVGRGVATPSAAQVAAIVAALLVTTLWARSRPQSNLARPALTVAGPGLLVVAVLAVLTWKAESWPPEPVLTCGVLVLAILELLRRRLPVTLVGLAEPLWWALVWSALISGVGPAPAGAAAAVGFVLIAEVAAAARRPVWAVALPALGAAAALASTWADARWATVALAAAAAWALGRRLRPYPLPHAAVVLDSVAAVLPVLALAALGAAADAPTALAAGTGSVLLATLPAVKPLLRRDADDTFWILWWRTAGALVALTALVIWPDSLSTSQRWLVITSLLTLAVASLFGPIPAHWRPWVATTLFTAAFLTGSEIVGLTDPTRAGILAAAALVLVGQAHRQGRQGKAVRREARSSMGLAGHALGVVAVLVALVAMDRGLGRVGWGLVVAVGLATAGWTLTTVMGNRDASPVGQALRQVGGWATWLPAVLAAVGVPLTVALALDAAGVLGFGDRWAMLVPATTAVAYAAATRLRLPDQIGATVAWAGFAAGILATTLTSARPPEIVAFASLVISVAVLRARRRAPVMTWAAWVALAPLAGLLAAQWWPWFEALPRQSALVMTMVSVGGVLLVGGSAFDLRGRPWVPRSVPAYTSTVAPVVIGATELAAGLALGYAALSREQAGWVGALAATAILATALLARAGALSGVATILGWTAVALLAGPQIHAHPWIPVVVTLLLLVAAQLLSLVQADTRAQARTVTGTGTDTGIGANAETGTDTDSEVETKPRWWARWDLPLLITAAPVAITALTAAGNDDRWGATFVMVGLECLLVTARLRRIPAVAVPVGVIGTALMLAGAGDAGQGWLSLALLGLAFALTALAADTRRSARLASQTGGALAALVSWQVATAWLGWTTQQTVNVTTLGAGLLAVAASLMARSDRIDRSWSQVWGGMAVAVAALLAGYTETIGGVGLSEAIPSYPVATGLLLVSVALVSGAGPFGQNRLRGLGFAFGVVAVVEFLEAGQAGSRTQVAVLSVLSAICATLSLSLFVSERAKTWQRSPLALGVAFAVGALAVAIPATSAQDLVLLAPGLAAGALQAAAVGIVLRRTVVQMLSPVLACASWLVFSSAAMSGNPQWVTMPLGLAILTMVELWRRDRKQHAGSVAATEIVVLEVTGIAFLIGASLVQTVTEAVAYAVLATALGVAVMGWSLLTRVRRRLAEGAAIVLVSLVMLVGVPLVGLLPAWQGAALWVLIAGVGLLALLVASFLEQGKTAVHKGIGQFSEATAGWE